MRDFDDKAELRPPSQVMRLARMGCGHPHRLSFMRILMRRIRDEAWRFEVSDWQIGDDGVGHAVYAAITPQRTYSLVAFAHDLPAEKRSDRVIATAWDTTFVLFDGVPTQADVARLRDNVPRQEAGRVCETELTLSRANRSVRLWAHVVEALSEGRQPDAELLTEVGYLMRTTAVYGSGKFGCQDRAMIADRPEFRAPFQAEMLTVYLIRAFVLDLVEHMARVRNAAAVKLDPALRRSLGIGNSTGLGMAPFIMNHPMLINNWVAAREEALARVRSLTTFTPADQAAFAKLVDRAVANVAAWRSEHPVQVAKLADLKADVAKLQAFVGAGQIVSWDGIYGWAEDALSAEGCELVVSLLLEPHGEFVDELADCMASDEHWQIDGRQTVGELRANLEEVYGFAEFTDWSAREEQARVWYTSQEKLEPRLGERFEEDRIAGYEQPLQPARDACALWQDLQQTPADMSVSDYLAADPTYRHAVRRAQITSRLPYAEVRDNTIHATMLPIDLLRFKLAFFGARHFDPRSDRWLRINMFAGAPFPHELTPENADNWFYPA
ncbi:MAG: hypothetical protein AAF393_08480 [Pseudomonadota bacterium]